MAPAGRLLPVIRVLVTDGRITQLEAVAEPDTLRAIEIALPAVPDAR